MFCGHSAQFPLPDEENVPVGHGEQYSEPRELQLPAGQIVHPAEVTPGESGTPK